MWIQLLYTQLIRGANGGYNTLWDRGFWADEQRKMWSRKPNLEAVIEAIEENPQEVIEAVAVEVPQIKKQIRQEIGRIDYKQLVNNLEMQKIVAVLVYKTIQSMEIEEEEEILLLM